MVVFTNVKKGDLEKLLKKGYQQDAVKTLYEVLRLKKGGVILILYYSGKLLLQGKEEKVKEIVKELKKVGIGKLAQSVIFREEKGIIIGSDESLKGDTFGGLVVAAVKADHKTRQELMKLGVADSKKLSDKEIMNMAEKIKKIVPCEIKSLLPEEYNSLTNHQNITELLNKLHQKCANYLLPGEHVVDKFPGCNVGDVREEKAESKYVEVAAASVLARATALKQLDYLSVQAGFTLPKGSTHVKDALQRLNDQGLDFEKFVKLNFNNVKEYL